MEVSCETYLLKKGMRVAIHSDLISRRYLLFYQNRLKSIRTRRVV